MQGPRVSDIPRQLRRVLRGPGAPLNKRQKSQVKRIVKFGREKKHRDEYSTGSEISTTGVVIDLMDIAEGDTSITRDGDQINLSAVYGQFQVLRDSTPDFPDLVRVLLIQWKQDTTATGEPTLAEVLFDVTNSPVLSNYNFENRSNYKVLRDWLLPIGGQENSVIAGPDDTVIRNQKIRRFRLNMKNVNKVVRYNTGATTGSNKLYLVTLGQKAPGAAASTLYFHIRSEFTDS